MYLLILKRGRLAPYGVLRYIRRPQGKGQAPGGLCLLSSNYATILTYFQTKINIKMTKNSVLVTLSEAFCPELVERSAVEWVYHKKALFLVQPPVRIYSLVSATCLKCRNTSFNSCLTAFSGSLITNS